MTEQGSRTFGRCMRRRLACDGIPHIARCMCSRLGSIDDGLAHQHGRGCDPRDDDAATAPDLERLSRAAERAAPGQGEAHKRAGTRRAHPGRAHDGGSAAPRRGGQPCSAASADRASGFCLAHTDVDAGQRISAAGAHRDPELRESEPRQCRGERGPAYRRRRRHRRRAEERQGLAAPAPRGAAGETPSAHARHDVRVVRASEACGCDMPTRSTSSRTQSSYIRIFQSSSHAIDEYTCRIHRCEAHSQRAQTYNQRTELTRAS
eukprot:6010215-Pleurochrysis_carterae.AAC.3